jgi:hypothetical protein
MPFPFKPYRSTRSTREVLARLRLKLVLSKSPLLILWPRDRTSAERAKSFFLLHSFGVVVLSVPCCLSYHSLSRFSGLIALLLVAVSRYCIEVSVERTRTHWRKDRQMEEGPWRSTTTSAPRILDMTFDRCSTSHPTS